MIVEFLTFPVDPGDVERWLAADRRLWTGFLRTVPGFVRKETWSDPGHPGTVHAVIWWENRAAWQSITPDQVAAIDEQMGEWYREPTMREFVVVE